MLSDSISSCRMFSKEIISMITLILGLSFWERVSIVTCIYSFPGRTEVEGRVNLSYSVMSNSLCMEKFLKF